jgi:CDP-glucose 4,6-dehydratase
MELLHKTAWADDSWNFGPDPKDCISVRQVLNKMNNNWGEIIWNDVSTDFKVHEANLLRLDCSKAQLTLGWKPVWNVDKALEHTASWYKAYYKDKQLISLKQLECFVEDAKRKSIAWTR